MAQPSVCERVVEIQMIYLPALLQAHTRQNFCYDIISHRRKALVMEIMLFITTKHQSLLYFTTLPQWFFWRHRTNLKCNVFRSVGLLATVQHCIPSKAEIGILTATFYRAYSLFFRAFLISGSSLSWKRAHELILNLIGAFRSRLEYRRHCSSLTAYSEESTSLSGDSCFVVLPLSVSFFSLKLSFSMNCPGQSLEIYLVPSVASGEDMSSIHTLAAWQYAPPRCIQFLTVGKGGNIYLLQILRVSSTLVFVSSDNIYGSCSLDCPCRRPSPPNCRVYSTFMSCF